MSRHTRLIVALVGLILIALSLALLLYALWPLDASQQRVPLPPELFRQPGAWLPLPGAIG